MEILQIEPVYDGAGGTSAVNNYRVMCYSYYGGTYEMLRGTHAECQRFIEDRMDSRITVAAPIGQKFTSTASIQ